MSKLSYVDPGDLRYLNKMVNNAEKRSVEFANNTIKHLALRFVISARRLTGPDNTKGPRSLKKKNRLRPVVSLNIRQQRMLGEFWYKDRAKGNIFSLKHEISRRGRSAQSLTNFNNGGPNDRIVPVTRAIKAWHKKRKRFVFIGTDKTRGLNGGPIPGAGAGKAGWIMLGKNLGQKKNTNIGRIRSAVGRTTIKRGSNPIINHTNRVDYVSKISSGVVAKSMRKVTNFFKAKQKKKWVKMVKKEFRVWK